MRRLPRHLHCLRTAAAVPTLIRPFILSNSKRCLIIYQTEGIILKGTLLTPEHRLKCSYYDASQATAGSVLVRSTTM